jgi:tetratricopeptide (TPR) repeat protein
VSQKQRYQFQSYLAETEAGVFLRELAYDRADELMTKLEQLDELAGTSKVEQAGHLANHGTIFSSMKRFDEAEAKFRQALALLEKGAAESYPLYRILWIDIADLRQQRGDQAGAVDSLGRAIALGEKYLPPDAFPLAQAYLMQGDALTHVGRAAAAKTSILRGISILLKTPSAPRPLLGFGYVYLAKVLLDLGDAAEGLATIVRAMAILDKIKLSPENHAGIDLIYAEALWKARKDPRAKELVATARKLAEESGNADNLAEANALARAMR